MTIRFAVIGAGRMARVMVPQFAACDGIELTTVVSRTTARGKEFAEECGIRHVIGLGELSDADVDAVYIATPHHNHCELATAAIEAGKSTLVEKAFVMNADEAELIVALARSRGVFLMEAMWMRFNHAVRAAHELIVAGRIGEPRQLTASFGRPVPFDRSHRLWDPARGGGSLLDQGVYPLALADLLFGAPTKIAAEGSRLDYDGRDAGIETEASVLLGYAGGQQAVSSTSIRAALPTHATIGGSAGLLQLAAPFWATDRFEVVDSAGAMEAFTFPSIDHGYVPMLEGVRDAVVSGWTEHPLAPLDSSVRVMRAVDEVGRQIRLR